MPMTIGVRREDLSKTGEKRVAITPHTATTLLENGHKLLIQPGIHYLSGDNKRAFGDQAYTDVGAEISEDLSDAQVVFGLKEVEFRTAITRKDLSVFLPYP